ncbi:MAG: hypothetical protein JWL67_299, partial [Solirubrobacterales bacterium]|nr:hypothetical protein [Solirubrobacterales bacterium]
AAPPAKAIDATAPSATANATRRNTLAKRGWEE